MSRRKEKLKNARQMASLKHAFQQNKGKFGFMPVSDIPARVKDRSTNQSVHIIDAHKLLAKDGRPNYRGLQIPVKSSLNYEKFTSYLKNYWDWQLPLFIKFGFPLDIDRNKEIVSDQRNHKSAYSTGLMLTNI